MQDIVFYVAAGETLGIVRDYANARNLSAPILVLGVSARLRMRLFADSETATPYPVSSFSAVTNWKWRMDSDFDRDTPFKLNADNDNISVQTVTVTVDGATTSCTEFAIPIPDMNTVELSAWLGNEKKRSGLTGELVGYDSSGDAVFVLQVDDFTVRNRVAGLNEPTSNRQEYLTRSQTELLVSSAAAAKQDRLTSANAGTGIAIDSNGVISNTYTLPYATTGTSGGVLLANGAEIVSGTDADKAVTPAALKTALTGGTAFVPQEAVSPFIAITDLGTAATVSLAAGHAYKLSALSGNHYISVQAPAAGYYGMDAHLELFVSDTSRVHFTSPLVLLDPLVPNAGNSILVRFRDGMAQAYVEDSNAGYAVTVSGGTGEGTLAYAMTTASSPYVIFSEELDGTTYNMTGITPGAAKYLHGEGIGNTAVTGSLASSYPLGLYTLTVHNLTLASGQLAVGGVEITGLLVNGSTVSFSGMNVLGGTVCGSGRLAFVTGTTISSPHRTGVIDLSGATTNVSAAGVDVTLSGITITGKRSVTPAALIVLRQGNVDGNAYLTDCVITGNTTTNADGTDLAESGGGLKTTGTWFAGKLVLRGCTISENYSASHRGIFHGAGYLELYDVVAGLTDGDSQQISLYSGSDTMCREAYVNGITFHGWSFFSNGGGGTQLGGCPLHIQQGSVIRGSTRLGVNNTLAGGLLSVGSYDADGEWIVGGTATVIDRSGGTNTVSGFGTYILGGGTNDLSFSKNNYDLVLRSRIRTHEAVVFGGTNTLTFQGHYLPIPDDMIVAPIGIEATATLTCRQQGAYGTAPVDLTSFAGFGITGSTITKQGLILGATVTVPSGSTAHVSYYPTGSSELTETTLTETTVIPGKLAHTGIN